MEFEIKEWPPVALEQYAAISIAFEVRSVFDVVANGQTFSLIERLIDRPYIKDYDAIAGNHPRELSSRFDLSNWGVLLAECGSALLGGALVTFDTPALENVGERKDLAVLWDIRVNPRARRHGVGSALLRAAEAWAEAKGCRQLKIETQNTNVPACKFYERHGYVLAKANPDAYPALPNETQLIYLHPGLNLLPKIV